MEEGSETDKDVLAHLSKNETLAAVADLCAPPPGSADGCVCSIVSYNYDDLLERALAGRRKTKSIWRPKQGLKGGQLPIYHVHGFLPFRKKKGSSPNELIFTETQYHATANDPYHWSNLVQIKTMSSHVGLMIGMSMTDRNVRRLLDALSTTPVKSEIYVVLQTPGVATLKASEVKGIRLSARKHLETFRASAAKQRFQQLSGVKPSTVGMKSLRRTGGRSIGMKARRSTGGEKPRTTEHRQVESILNAVKGQDFEVNDGILRSLGVIPIWIDDFAEIAEIVKEITFVHSESA